MNHGTMRTPCCSAQTLHLRYLSKHEVEQTTGSVAGERERERRRGRERPRLLLGIKKKPFAQETVMK